MQSIVDTMLRVAWNTNRGGFHLAGSSFGPAHIESTVLFEKNKLWWVQADGLKALLTMARLRPRSHVDYEAYFLRLWDYIKTYVIDAHRGGWLAVGFDTNPDERKLAKATMWKDSSHEVEALLDCSWLLGSPYLPQTSLHLVQKSTDALP